MIIQELLKTCEYKKIAKMWIEEEVYKNIDVEQLTAVIENFCDTLCNLIPNTNKYIFLAHRHWNDDREHISGDLYKKDELKNALQNIDKCIIPSAENITEDDSLEKYQNILAEMEKLHLQSYAYELTPWEDVIGAEVIMKSIDCYSCVPFLSDVLKTLSFYGMKREQQQESIDKLQEAIEEYKNGKCRTFDFDEICEKYGLEKPTEEKLEEHHRQFLYEQAKNTAERYKELKEIAGTE